MDAAQEHFEDGLAAGRECLAAALDYRRAGWSPLCLCPPDHTAVGKFHRCDSPGKRPMHAWAELQVEPATEKQVRDWWGQWPSANVGIALGPVSGLLGVDVDDEEGERLLSNLCGDDGPEVTLEFRSGKGRRLLYRLPPGVRVRPTHISEEKRRPLSLLGLGAQTVMPPSRHRSGRRYEWVPGRGPGEIDPATAPGWLLDALRDDRARAPRAQLADGELIEEGARNVTLCSMAGSMRARGFGEGAIRAALAQENADRCEPPLPEGDIETIARSVARYEPDAMAGVVLRLPTARQAAPAAPAAEFGPPVPASMLRKVEDGKNWVWHGYLNRGGITMLSALWKAGKTTLLAHLLHALEAGGRFCDLEVAPSRVLYVTEEHESIWAERRDEVGIADHAEYLIRPFGVKPTMERWVEFLGYLQGVCQERKYDLVVFDTLSNLWPVKDENDAARVQEALMPLRAVSDLCAFLLVHHLRKGDGAEATASRGSGALPAFVDTILELRRFDAANRKDCRRVIHGVGRWRETRDEAVVELTPEGYAYHGDKADAGFHDLRRQVAEALPPAAPGCTREELVAELWPEGGDRPPPGKKRLLDLLREGGEQGWWVVEGGGKRGSPLTYWRPAAFPGG